MFNVVVVFTGVTVNCKLVSKDRAESVELDMALPRRDSSAATFSFISDLGVAPPSSEIIVDALLRLQML